MSRTLRSISSTEVPGSALIPMLIWPSSIFGKNCWKPGKKDAESLVRWLPAQDRALALEILLTGRRIAQEWVGLEVLTREVWHD